MNSPTRRRAELAARALVLELRHPAGLAEAGEAAQHPGQLACSGTWLCTNNVAALRVEAAARAAAAAATAGAPAQHRRVVRHGDRVQVGDEVEGVEARPASPPTAGARPGSCRGGTSRPWAGCPDSTRSGAPARPGSTRRSHHAAHPLNSRDPRAGRPAARRRRPAGARPIRGRLQCVPALRRAVGQRARDPPQLTLRRHRRRRRAGGQRGRAGSVRSAARGPGRPRRRGGVPARQGMRRRDRAARAGRSSPRSASLTRRTASPRSDRLRLRSPLGREVSPSSREPAYVIPAAGVRRAAGRAPPAAGGRR